MFIPRRDKAKFLNTLRKQYIEKGKKTKGQKMPSWTEFVRGKI